MKRLIFFTICLYVSQIVAQPTATNISYGSHSAHKLDYFAATNANSPILMLVHGGGWSSGDKANPPYTNLAQLYKNMGYAVVTINYRFCTEVGYTGHPTIPSDVACALAWTKTNAALINGDSSKILLYGQSAGGHLVTLHGLTHPANLLAGCAYTTGLRVSGVMAANPAVNFDNINPARYADIKPMVKDSLNYWRAADPTYNLSFGSKVKFLLLIGQNDGFLGTQQSMVFRDSMTRYNYCKRYYLLPGHDHNTPLTNLTVNDPVFNIMRAWSDSLWQNQLCPAITALDEKSISNVNVFPNPAGEKVFIQGLTNAPCEILLISLLGEVKLHLTNTSEIPTGDLMSGMYLLRVKQNSSETIFRLVKE